jgi:hypothetical protein
MDMTHFEVGPPIDEAVISWLDGNAGSRVLQLPVEIHGSPLRIKSSYLRAGAIGIELRLDTGALSIDLPMHLKRYCQSYPCRVWLQGTWGPLVQGTAGQNLPVFAVKKVVSVAGLDATHVLFPR